MHLNFLSLSNLFSRSLKATICSRKSRTAEQVDPLSLLRALKERRKEKAKREKEKREKK